MSVGIWYNDVNYGEITVCTVEQPNYNIIMTSFTYSLSILMPTGTTTLLREMRYSGKISCCKKVYPIFDIPEYSVIR